MSGLGCVFEPEGDALKGNTFVNDGYYANPSNSDFGQIVLHAGLPSNCFTDNTAPGGSAPANLEQLQPVCGVTTTTTNGDSTLLGQVECDARLLPCPPDSKYPPQTGVRLAPLPSGSAHHGKPVCGSTLQCVVSVDRVERVVTRDAERWPVGRPRSGRCRRCRPALCAVGEVNRTGGPDHLVAGRIRCPCNEP